MTDPRLKEVSAISRAIVDRIIRHAVYVEKYKSYEVNRMMRFLNRDVVPDLMRELNKRLAAIVEAGIEGETFTKLRLENLYKSLDEILTTGIRTARIDLTNDLKEFVVLEAEWNGEMLKQALSEYIRIDFNIPAPKLLHKIVYSRPFQGKILRGHFDHLSKVAMKDIKKQIQVGMVRGEGTNKIVSRIRGTMAEAYTDGSIGRLRRDAETLVRTATHHISNVASFSAMQENKDVLEGWRFVATLDAQTTDICMSRDGNIYTWDDYLDKPPLHMRCRSKPSPELKSWKELGFPDMKEVPKSTRAALGGPVPAKFKYGDWLKNQSAEVQKHVLGKKRYELYRKGFKFDKFFDDRGHMINLKKLYELEKIA